MPREATDIPDEDRTALGPGDLAIFEVVEKAQEQYRGYLAATELASLARMTARRPGDQPPRTDLPLTLIVRKAGGHHALLE